MLPQVECFERLGLVDAKHTDDTLATDGTNGLFFTEELQSTGVARN